MARFCQGGVRGVQDSSLFARGRGTPLAIGEVIDCVARLSGRSLAGFPDYRVADADNALARSRSETGLLPPGRGAFRLRKTAQPGNWRLCRARSWRIESGGNGRSAKPARSISDAVLRRQAASFYPAITGRGLEPRKFAPAFCGRAGPLYVCGLFRTVALRQGLRKALLRKPLAPLPAGISCTGVVAKAEHDPAQRRDGLITDRMLCFIPAPPAP